MKKAELAGLIGTPFKYCGRGPNSFDCYGLVREIYRRDGIEIPDLVYRADGSVMTAVAISASSVKSVWQELDFPEHGSVLMFKVPGNMHVGYYLGNDEFIHSWEGSGGVTIERLSFGWKNRIVGIYRYVGQQKTPG